jgi:chromatin remodeling complex protein RSC6
MENFLIEQFETTKKVDTKKVDTKKQLDIMSEFGNVIENLTLFKSQISLLQQKIKFLEKHVKKQMKVMKKDNIKNIKKGNRQPSGFAKPSKVTKELCEFMNKSEGTEIARTEVTRALVSYIKTNKLENINNSKFITPDSKLKFLLGIEDGEELTYFNIQKYMNKHFVKTCEI